MLKLIKNDIFKAFKNIKIYIYMAIITLISFALVFVIKVVSDRGIENIDFTKGDFPVIAFAFNADLVFPILVMLLVINCFLEELNCSTITLPLMNGVQRAKLLSAKFISIFLLFLVLLFTQFISSYLVCVLFISNNVDILLNIKMYLLSIFPYTAFIILVILTSMFISNIGVILGCGITILVATIVITNLKIDFLQYLVFYQLKQILDINKSNFIGTFIFSSIIYIIFGYLISIFKFNKLEL